MLIGGADVPVIGAAARVILMICRAGLPGIAAVLGAITIAAVLGVAARLVGVAALPGAALLAVRVCRRRAACRTALPRTRA